MDRKRSQRLWYLKDFSKKIRFNRFDRQTCLFNVFSWYFLPGGWVICQFDEISTDWIHWIRGLRRRRSPTSSLPCRDKMSGRCNRWMTRPGSIDSDGMDIMDIYGHHGHLKGDRGRSQSLRTLMHSVKSISKYIEKAIWGLWCYYRPLPSVTGDRNHTLNAFSTCVDCSRQTPNSDGGSRAWSDQVYPRFLIRDFGCCILHGLQLDQSSWAKDLRSRWVGGNGLVLWHVELEEASWGPKAARSWDAWETLEKARCFPGEGGRFALSIAARGEAEKVQAWGSKPKGWGRLESETCLPLMLHLWGVRGLFMFYHVLSII